MEQNHVNEAIMIDYVLGKLSSNKNEAIGQHIMNCSDCKKELRYWEHLLNVESNLQPSPVLISKIYESIDNKQIAKKKRNWKKATLVITSFATAILVLFSIYYMNFDNVFINKRDQNYVMVQHDKKQEQKLIRNPETDQLDISPVTNNQNIHGEVWLNKETNELMLRVDGLAPIKSQDYQLWIIHTNDDWNGEILHLENGSARVYYRSPDIKLLRFLRVSVEPLGGSNLPTGPETFYVDLNNK